MCAGPHVDICGQDLVFFLDILQMLAMSKGLPLT